MRKRAVITLFILLSISIGQYFLYHYFYNFPLVDPLIKTAQIAGVAAPLFLGLFLLARYSKNIKQICYDSVKENFVQRALENRYGRPRFGHILLLSYLINFLFTSILAVYVMNPAMHNDDFDLSIIPIIGSYLKPLLKDSAPLASWMAQNFVYTIMLSSIGPGVVFFLRQIRTQIKVQRPSSFPGTNMLMIFLYLSPLVLFFSSRPPNDPILFKVTMIMTASLSIVVTIVSFVFVVMEKYLPKLLGIEKNEKSKLPEYEP
ncbi:MAG: hypothetical protein WAO91_10495 [Candidatus Nitrosotenuis sp.]